MKVRKTKSSSKPGYPNTRQFLASLGVGAMAAAAQGESMPLGGVPPPPKQVVTNTPAAESRLLGDIAVVPVQVPGEMPAVTNRVPAVPTNTVSYTVRKGDTLTGIARTQLGDAARIKDILSLNPGIDPAALAIGAVLVLPARAQGDAIAKGVMPAPRLPGKPASPK
jgi:nucleoid-associated protein YgaU